ncbi:Zn-dependent protease [Spirochaetia bacterium]|nr:Zn-dependent protease [Spirochaetia bacterium]
MRKFEGIDPKSWEHPADTAALSALRQLHGIDDLVKSLVSITTERSLKLMTLASAVKVSPVQYPKLNNILNEILEIFDWDYRPDLFVTQSPFLNAGVMGVKEPFITLNSSMLNSLEDDELRAVIAHEVGHIMSGHTLYKTLVWLIANISMSLIPIPQILLLPIQAALLEWDRKSELTADRAGLLAVRSPASSYHILMKLSGAQDPAQVDLNEFFLQAQEYEEQKTLIDSVHKFLNQLWLSHPYPVIRLSELRTWEASGQYQEILDGNYMYRGEGKDNPADDMRAGYEYYKESMQQNDDPISRIFNNLGNVVDNVGKSLKDTLEGMGKRS